MKQLLKLGIIFLVISIISIVYVCYDNYKKTQTEEGLTLYDDIINPTYNYDGTRNSILDGIDTIPVEEEDPPVCDNETSNLDRYLSCCDNVGKSNDKFAYCEATGSEGDKLLKQKVIDNVSYALPLNGTCTKAYTSREYCRMMRHNQFAAKFATTCSAAEKYGMLWCPNEGKSVPGNSSSLKPTYDTNTCESGNYVAPTSEKCKDPCYLYGYNDTRCTQKEYNKHGDQTGLMNPGGVQSGFMNREIVELEELENEGFVTVQEMQENENTIKTTRNYDEYNKAWNNFSTRSNTLHFENDDDPIQKKGPCSETNGVLFFNDPPSVSCYQSIFKDVGCKDIAQPETIDDVPENKRNLNTYREHVETQKHKATQNMIDANDIEKEEIDAAHKFCYGASRNEPNSFLGETSIKNKGLKASIHRVNNDKGEYNMFPVKSYILDSTANFDSTRAVFDSIANKEGERFMIIVKGSVRYPKNCVEVQYGVYSDDGAILNINGEEIIQNWKLQGCNVKYSDMIPVTKHIHSIEAKMYENYGGQCFRIVRAMFDSEGYQIDENGNRFKIALLYATKDNARHQYISRDNMISSYIE
jgi:hypothetical protein